MNIHKNARLTPSGRERIFRQFESGQTPKAIAEAAGVCPRTVRKWIDRYRCEGSAGLQDRSSRPHRLHRPTAQAIVEQVERLRRQRYTGKQIAAELHISPATVSRILRRLGLNKLSALEPAEPIRRFATISSGLCFFLGISVLLDAKIHTSSRTASKGADQLHWSGLYRDAPATTAWQLVQPA